MSIRRTFKLKVNQVLHRPHSSASVNSTLDLPLKDTKLSGAYEHVYQINPSNEVDGLLLPGEITVGHAKEVISYVLHDENRRGISGLLVCTNFRLMFVTDKPPYCNLIAVENKLIGPQDVTLSNIETIYIEKQNGKRKKLYTTSRSIKDGIQKLEIHCKDFRILTYSFKFSVLGEGKNIVRAILHHSYPQDSSLSFAMEYISKKPNNKETTDGSNVVLYRKVDDWEKLIMTSQAMKGRWRVTTINQTFSLSATMPGLFVVPSSLSDAFLKDAIHQYNNNRLPIWCYTHSNKCSLLRSSNFREESVQFQVDQKIRQEITKCDPSGRKIRVMDLNKLCPTLQQIQISFHKLKTSCMPANEDDYMDIDGKWLSTLQNIKWLQYISCCLDVTRSCVDHIHNGLGTILLVEQLGVDWTACISCLIQVMIDPTKRTIKGISELIQREWIIGCHPFTTRLGTLYQPKKISKFQSDSSDDGEICKSPIFLLFLDCLYQILAQQSTKVEYTSFFLTSLADGTRLPVFDSFIFNNERERNRTLQQLFTDCSCIIGTNKTAMSGVCKIQPCGGGGKYIYLVIMFLSLFFTFLVAVPSIQISVRVVPFTQRTFAIGFQWLMIRVLGSIPGPLLYGYLLDRACLIRGDSCGSESSCKVYRNQNISINVLTCTMILKIFGLLCMIAVYYFYNPNDEDGDNNDVTVVESAPSNGSNIKGNVNESYKTEEDEKVTTKL